MINSRWYSRTAVGAFVLSPGIQRFVIVVILLNAVVLGLEAIPTVAVAFHTTLVALDTVCLGIFVVEIALKLYAQGWRFFTDAWNVFDFLVVGVALLPFTQGLGVLRTLRVLRVLRLISVVPALRRVVDALVRAIPGIASIALLLGIIFYVGGVMATMLFGERFPELFGNLGDSLFSLFQVMTLDNWSVIAREVTAEIPWAPAFFIPFVLISALTVLNLFVAVIVDAMQGMDQPKPRRAPQAEPDAVVEGDITAQIAGMRREISRLTAVIERHDR